MAEYRPITGSVVLTARDHFDALWWAVGRLFRIGIVVIVIALLALVAVSEIYTGSQLDLGSTPIFLLAAILLWPLFIVWLHWRLPPEQKQVSYEIDEQQVATRDAAGALVALPWGVLWRVVEFNSGFGLAVRPAGARWMPKRAFTPAATAALRNLARVKLGKAAEVRDSGSN